MCRVFGVSRTGFHNWERRAPSDRALQDAWLTDEAHRIYSDWSPNFFDYLYLSLTNASSFSPTDTLRLTRWAKLTMGVQSVASLVTVGWSWPAPSTSPADDAAQCLLDHRVRFVTATGIIRKAWAPGSPGEGEIGRTASAADVEDRPE
jgi:hypothetical protein